MAELIARLQQSIGDRYVVHRELGHGGMASVFLADDLKHGRRVAVKVLLPQLAAAIGPSRFLREIEIAARLTHPHILPLFDSGDADGLLYYVMPLVEGESLRQLLTRTGPLPIDDAVRIARQVAAALDHAHRQGVVHRDIKPENILLHEGQALLADFGIALAVSATGEERLTGTGISVGTPSYMSPEQATGGRHVDARSDIYSLGCVLYEMLTGDPPFTGSSIQAVVARIVIESPVKLRALRDTVPEPLEAVVHRALAKVPADRFATAAEFDEALESPDRFARHGTSRRAWGRVAWGAGVMALGLAAIALVTWWRGHSDARSPGAPHERQLTFSMDAHDVALSPDGQTVAYVTAGRKKLIARDVANGAEIVVAVDSGGLALPQWSPDGATLLFEVVAAARWFEVSRRGGTPTLVAGTNLSLGYCRQGPWRYCGNYQGAIYLGSAPSTVHPVGTDSIVGEGRIVLLASHFKWITSNDPQPSPGGRWIAMAGTTSSGEEVLAIVDSMGRGFQILDRQLDRDGSGVTEWMGPPVRWSPRGDAIYYGRPMGPGWSIWKARVNLRTGALRGPPVPVLERLPSWFYYDVSRDGRRLVYSGGPGQAALYSIPIDHPQRAVPLAAGTWSRTGARVSPDGKVVAYVREQSNGKADVFAMDVGGGQERRLTSDSARKFNPSWSADGRQLAYLVLTDSGLLVVVTDLASGRTRTVAAQHVSGGRPEWSPDGRLLLYQRAGNRNWGVIDLRTGSEHALLSDDSLGWAFNPMFSPDGRQVAIVRNIPPRESLWWVDLASNRTSETPFPPGDGEWFRWTREGYLYYAGMGGDQAIHRIDRYRATGARGEVFASFTTPCEYDSGIDISFERRTVVCSVNPLQVDVWVIDDFDPSEQR